jgi:selenocysteine lyase/cysteine desulfurase
VVRKIFPLDPLITSVRPNARQQFNRCNNAAVKEVIFITTSTALLIVAVVSASMAFATLVLKIVEVSRKK